MFFIGKMKGEYTMASFKISDEIKVSDKVEILLSNIEITENNSLLRRI